MNGKRERKSQSMITHSQGSITKAIRHFLSRSHHLDYVRYFRQRRRNHMKMKLCSIGGEIYLYLYIVTFYLLEGEWWRRLADWMDEWMELWKVTWRLKRKNYDKEFFVNEPSKSLINGLIIERDTFSTRVEVLSFFLSSSILGFSPSSFRQF